MYKDTLFFIYKEFYFFFFNNKPNSSLCREAKKIAGGNVKYSNTLSSTYHPPTNTYHGRSWLGVGRELITGL